MRGIPERTGKKTDGRGMKPCGRIRMYGKGRGGQVLHCNSARHALAHTQRVPNSVRLLLAHGEALRLQYSCMSVSHALFQHRLRCVRLSLSHGLLLPGLHSMENTPACFTLSDSRFPSVPPQNAVGMGFAHAGRLCFAVRVRAGIRSPRRPSSPRPPIRRTIMDC